MSGEEAGETGEYLSPVPLAALDLPLRVLVRLRDDGQTAIAFRPIGAVLRRSGAPDALAGRLDPAQRIPLNAVKS